MKFRFPRIEISFTSLILRSPLAILILLGLTSVFLAFGVSKFRIDASSDSLRLENDSDTAYFRKVSQRFDASEFVFITFTPKEKLLSRSSLKKIAELKADLQKMPSVSSVTTLLDVPLLKNPPGELSDLPKNMKTLEHESVNLEMAEEELKSSPLYQNLLVSPDLRTTAVQVNFKNNPEHEKIIVRRNFLVSKKDSTPLNAAEVAELSKLESKHREFKDLHREGRHQDISKIREIIASYRSDATVFIGGVPMIIDDILTFIESDLKYFGLGLIIFLILALKIIFRNKRWVFLPMICCLLSALIMIGFLGFLSWDVTVVSSNFISLQLIFTMSLAIHIIVRYKEYFKKNPDWENEKIIRETVLHTFTPCLYASLTTIAGFSSLIGSDILPVSNFGWMMTLGLMVSFVVTFTFIPTVLTFLKKPEALESREFGQPLTTAFANLTANKPKLIFASSTILLLVTAFGVTRLEVENSFIDYFKESTDIYQGMKFIDEELGGTTPLDIMITMDSGNDAEGTPAPQTATTEADDDFDDFGEFEEKTADDGKYWFTQKKLRLINQIHDYIDSLPATGKVMSLATLEKTVRDLNKGNELDNIMLALLFGNMPDKFQDLLIKPYVAVDKDQVRISTRIKDSQPGLRRNQLLQDIEKDLEKKFELSKDQFRLTGVMVLYNNMLQSLFKSQISTIGYTLLALAIMFLLLFSSLKVAIIAIFPSLLSSMSVLGLMGLLGIPLDIMTITIVAISVGIAVDDTIHYLHRFKQELKVDGDYMGAMRRSHGSIGNAMYYTSLTITMGFSLLCISTFIPTIVFGLMTALAMLMALVASLSLLPRLILLVRPFST